MEVGGREEGDRTRSNKELRDLGREGFRTGGTQEMRDN